MSFGGVGGGSSSIQGSSDVFLSGPANGQVLSYNTGVLKWVNTGLATSDIGGLQTALNGKANTADLADVATTGQYTDLVNHPPVIQYAYYDTSAASWPARPVADTVVWVGANELSPPPSPEIGKDIWIRDAEVV